MIQYIKNTVPKVTYPNKIVYHRVSDAFSYFDEIELARTSY